MGTRSVTIVMSDSDRGDEPQELVRIYRQYDGYPEGHGLELAKLCDRKIVNGISLMEKEPVANGMGDLGALIVMGLKQNHEVGGIYLEVPQGNVNDWAEYIYTITGKEGEKPTIECRTHVGPPPFNLQTTEGLVFKGTAAEWLAQDWSNKDE